MSGLHTRSKDKSRAVIKVLVINCGTGVRVAQMLKRIKVLGEDRKSILEKDEYRLNILGYHYSNKVADLFKHGDWEKHLENPECVQTKGFTTDKREASKWLNGTDVVLLLHTTYDKMETQRVRYILDCLEDDTVVLARGFADHSFIGSAHYQSVGRDFLAATNYRSWNHIYLREMAIGGEWSALNPVDAISGMTDSTLLTSCDEIEAGGQFYPIKIMKQNMLLDSSSIASVISYLSVKLPEATLNGIRHQMKAVSVSMPDNARYANTYINMDDYVYCFIKRRPKNCEEKIIVRVFYGDVVCRNSQITDMDNAGITS